MRDSSAALRWIVGLLRQVGQPFAVVGGLAANAYGSQRPLNDIDIDLSIGAFEKLLPLVRPYVKFGPAKYQDSFFDLDLMVLNYADQDIDLTAAETIRIFNRTSELWCDLPTDLSLVNQRSVLGVDVPVMNRELLVAYKKMVGREVDLEDILQLERF